MLSILGSFFKDISGDRWLIGVLGMLLPMPSTGASRLLMLLIVGVRENKDRTFDVRFEYFEFDSRRKKSERNAFAC